MASSSVVRVPADPADRRQLGDHLYVPQQEAPIVGGLLVRRGEGRPVGLVRELRRPAGSAHLTHGDG
jgi:hypothetical protein